MNKADEMKQAEECLRDNAGIVAKRSIRATEGLMFSGLFHTTENGFVGRVAFVDAGKG